MFNLFISFIANEDTLFGHLLDVAMLLFILYLCYLFAEKFFSKYIKFDSSSAIERFVFLEGLGLVLFSYVIFLIGMLKILYNWVFVLLILMVFLLVLDRIADNIKCAKTVVRRKDRIPSSVQA